MFIPWLVLALVLLSPAGGPALAADEGSVVEGAGFSMFGTESIKGVDESKLKKDPVCDRGKRPRIAKVEPDEGKPGDKLVVTGENFGTKECFHGVTFSSAPQVHVDYKLVSDSTVELKIPQGISGMTFVIMVTGGGSSQSKPVLVEK